jgi:cellulose synthase/poly-beta-1,6-N-acetylglucosamine synthase-like glycosyltransferase
MPTTGLLICCVLFVYPFAIYPFVLRMLRPRSKARAANGGQLPSVALVICAFNERKVIQAKIENSLAADYPKDKLRIIVVSDGSTDGTAEVVRGYESRGVELIDQRPRRGKLANLNAVLPTCREEILVLSDANVMYNPDAIRHLVARFSDPEVGCVSGKVVLTDSADVLDAPTGQYYSMEWFLQDSGSKLYSMPGADGAMYAMRRELFQGCPADTIIEDFVIPMSIVRQGFRVVFEPKAVGWENGSMSIQEEFRRKVRIAAGATRALLRGYGWPKGAPARFWFVFLSHKLLRWISPVTGAAALVFALMSMQRAASQAVIAGVAVATLLSLARLYTRLSHPLLSSAFYFLFGQVATACGLVKGLAGRQSVLWAKANR